MDPDFRQILQVPRSIWGFQDGRVHPRAIGNFEDNAFTSLHRTGFCSGVALSQESSPAEAQFCPFRSGQDPMFISSQQSTNMGSNNQQPAIDQRPCLARKANPQLMRIGLNNERIIGTGMRSHQAMNLAISNQKSFTSRNQQPVTMWKLNTKVSFGMLLEVIRPHLDMDRAMQVDTLYLMFKKEGIISEDVFLGILRSLVGDEMINLGIYELQAQAARNSQIVPSQFKMQPLASAPQLQISSNAQIIREISNPACGSNKGNSPEVENQVDSSPLQSKSWMSSLESPGNNSKPPLKKPFVNYKKPTNARDSSTPPLSKKQKVSAAFLDQSIELLNDVTKISGVNLREENIVQHKASAQQLQMSPTAQIISKMNKPASRSKKGKSREVESQANSSQMQSNSWMPSPTSPLGNVYSSKAPLKNHLVAQKKPPRAPNSLYQPSSKRQKVSAAFMDQNIKQLNDVTAVSGVNLREEEKHFFPGHTEDSRISEGYRQLVLDKWLFFCVIKEEYVKLRAAAAFHVVRAATGIDDMLSKWQLMIEANQKQEGSETSYGYEPGKDAQQPLVAPTDTPGTFSGPKK